MAPVSNQTSTTSMIIDGVAASEAIDSSGEILDVEGCDTSDFENGVGLLNYEHRGDTAEGASGNDIVGKIIYSRKIYKKVDCEDKRQEAYWDHVKLPFIYIRARLYDGAEHPGAKALAAAIRDAVMHKEPILLRFSIEGSTLKKEGNRLVRTIGRKVALTFKPANKSAVSGLISDPSGPKPISEKQGQKSLLAQLLNDDTAKSEAPGRQRLGSYEMVYNPIVEEDTLELLKASAERIRELRQESEYVWHPIRYDFFKSIPLQKMTLNFDERYKPIEFALGTNKLRQLRDFLVRNKLETVNERDPRLPEPVRQALAHTGKDYAGNFSVSRIQQLIDSKPKTRFNHSTTEGQYAYIQRHNQLKSNVFQLNLTSEQAAKLQDAGVLDSFNNMHTVSVRSKHPVVPGTIGWVRWTGGQDGIHIDEVQSDYGRPWSSLITHQLAEAMALSPDDENFLTPQQAAHQQVELLKQLPDEHLKKVQKILFGNKHAAEILHEAFHHWARTTGGLVGAPVHVWAPEAKAALNGMDQTHKLPGHYIVTYKDIPEKMGMEEGKYGEIPTQDNTTIKRSKRVGKVGEEIDWKGSNKTYKDEIRKNEKLYKTTTGGGANAAPSTLIGSDALAREDDRLHQHDFKNKLRSALRDMGVEVVGKAAMLKFFKWRLPEVNETFLDHFTDLIGDVRAKPAGNVIDRIMSKAEAPPKQRALPCPRPAPVIECKDEAMEIEAASLVKRERMLIDMTHLAKTMDVEGTDEVYSVDDENAHGRFWVRNNELRILEDHEGILRRYLHNGPLDAGNKAGIGHILMEGHRISAESHVEEGKSINLGSETDDQIQGGEAPKVVEPPLSGTAPQNILSPAIVTTKDPAPIFDLMAQGHKKPDRVEIRGENIFQNGHKLSDDDAQHLLHMVHTGKATLRYHEEDERLVKMAKVFEKLSKTAPEVRQAMSGMRDAVKAGHIKPEHADAIRRGLFTDRLTGGKVGNFAAYEDHLEGLKNQKDQGVHVHMDANDFGSINKLHGKMVGDEAIRQLVGAQREAIDKHVGRKHAKLFRVGGDETVAHFKTKEHAAAFLRGVRENLDAKVPVGGTHRLSLSVGMGHTPEHAEQALINAKTEKKRQNYQVGQAGHRAHSLLPGHEGPVPMGVDRRLFPRMDQTSDEPAPPRSTPKLRIKA
jgi:GGDEF domain-containing protein